MRLVPARAGNTNHHHRMGRRRAAHPRSRGEHIAQDPDNWVWGGSSPLARGTLKKVICLTLISRLIPARAGDTLR